MARRGKKKGRPVSGWVILDKPVGMGSTDLRYRPEFSEWSILLRIEYDTEWISADTIVNLLERAGFGIGIGEMRPQKGGEFGRFQVDRGEQGE